MGVQWREEKREKKGVEPKFSVCLIARNEAKTLPKLMGTLGEFQKRGGEVVLLDTGSTDGTPSLARSLGCKVTEVGEMYLITLGRSDCQAINEMFVVNDEPPIVEEGDRLFQFADARNHAASLASHDIVSMPDCDEVFTALNIDEINSAIERGVEQMEFNFIYAHDPWGNPAIQFLQCKMYDRRKLHWVGAVHEVLRGEARRELLPSSTLLLEHWQNHEQPRGYYLKGLAWDCWRQPSYDRNSHYLGRELCWTNRPRSAIKELKRHIKMDGWPAEKAQSMIFIGDCYGKLNQPRDQVHWYREAYHTDPTRREALLRLAGFYKSNNQPLACAAYAGASLQIPQHHYYANQLCHYQEQPHEFLYWAKGWTGDIKGAQEHILKALQYQPYHPGILADTKYYFDYYDRGIEGWMRFPELLWLFEMAGKMESIIEVGSWKGRSTHALCSGCKKGMVAAVDHFQGSDEAAHHEARSGNTVYNQFKENTKECSNLKVIRAGSLETSSNIPDRSVDMVFIDASHTYADVVCDIRAWREKARLLLCGHDYCDQWPGVRQAVEEEIGAVEVHDSIWYKWLVNPLVSIIIPTLGRPEKLHRLLEKIKENAGYNNYEVIVKKDEFPPYNKGVPRLLAEAVEESKGELVMYLGNDCVPQKDFLLHAVLQMARSFPEMDGLVGLNDGYWQEGEIATHWLGSKKLLPHIGDHFFSLDYHHTGCDNELTERSRGLGKYVWAPDARVDHEHPMNKGETDEVYALAYQSDRLEHDRETLKKRAAKFKFTLRENILPPSARRIPRRITTCWLSTTGDIPSLVQKCIDSQKIPGYSHHIITLDNCDRSSRYVREALEAGKWVKASDYLRILDLYQHGGIYLDGDMEVLKGKTFDDLLHHRLFTSFECCGLYANAGMGVEPGHPLLKAYLDRVESNYRGDGDLVFEPGIRTFHDIFWATDKEKEGIVMLPTEVFFPYNHSTGEIKVTDNTRVYHHYMKSWKQPDILVGEGEKE